LNGLITDAATTAELQAKLEVLIPELLELNSEIGRWVSLNVHKGWGAAWLLLDVRKPDVPQKAKDRPRAEGPL